MAATRSPFTSASPPPVGGPSFVDQVSDNVKATFNSLPLPISNVGGTANDITGDVLPDFDGNGLIDGMSFRFSPASTNTGSMTVAINTQAAVPLLLYDGSALTGGEVAVGSVFDITYWNGNFALMNGVAPGQAVTFGHDAYTSNGTWNKPAGINGNRMILVEGWGAGGGGATGQDRGGGGGAYIHRHFKAGDLPASVPVTIGVGGSTETDGTASTFGTLLTAGGGQAAGLGAGFEGQGGSPGGISDYRNAEGSDAMTLWHGGSGTRGSTRAGHSIFGGGGGGAPGLAAGTSVFGGNGGANGAAGEAPGGGGGKNAAGARGEFRVTLL